MPQLISLFGLFAMLGFAWLMSSDRWRINARIVVGGVALQFAFAAFLLKTDIGSDAFRSIGAGLGALLDLVDAGPIFVFGPDFEEHYFAFKVLPIIIFFSALMSLLYHYGIMQRMIAAVALVMRKTLGTSGAESLAAAANIFVGQVEAGLAVRPYLGRMTNSELMAVMVGGFATVAGSVLVAYMAFDIDAAHLLTASVISAPASLVIAKILQPEVDQPATLDTATVEVEVQSVNALHAITLGAAEGVKLAINVAAMIIAFLALLAMADALVAWVGLRVGQTWSMGALFGYCFAPFAWLMGVTPKDCLKIGELLGVKIVANEFIAYQRLDQWLQPGSPVSLEPRSVTIATYALCGFANFGSIGVQLGGLGPLAPSRQPDLARLAFRAMLGGTLAAFMTACVAGVLL